MTVTPAPSEAPVEPAPTAPPGSAPAPGAPAAPATPAEPAPVTGAPAPGAPAPGAAPTETPTAGPPTAAPPTPAEAPTEDPTDEATEDAPEDSEPEEEEDAEPTTVVAPVLPSPAPEIPAPLYKGRGMLIAGSILGIGGFVVKTVVSAGAFRLVRNPDPGVTGTDFIVGGSLIYNPIIGAGIGLIGGGLAQRGEWDAHHELFDSAAHDPKMKKSRRKLGWGLFGGGVAWWAASRLLSLACKTDRCSVTTLELGYYSSLAMTVPGMALAGWGTGHDNYVRRFGHMKKKGGVQLTPTAGASWGLSLAGTF